MHKLDQLLAAYRQDANQLDAFLAEVTSTAKQIASRIDRQVDADDIGQQVAIAIWSMLPTISTEVAGLVITMTKNRSIDAIRTPTRNSTDEIPDDPGESASTSAWGDRTRRIAVEVLGDTVVDLLHRGYNLTEIAELTGVPGSTLRSQVAKVRKLAAASSKRVA